MKTIVVASGKGGTGKTTLSAVFSHLAATESSVVVVDTDVEASNLPIALHAGNGTCEAFGGGATASIDPEVCCACGACVSACRFGAILPPAHPEEALAYHIDPWACEGCGACARICPNDAIEMIPARAGEACTADSVVGPLAYGQLLPGEDLSGKLVTEVRGRAKRLAEQHSADLIIIDGPPGIGCPVIAAITNTDMLIAVTEPSASGEHDLMRLCALARRLDVPVNVVLNKADLSQSGAERIRAACDREGLPLLAEVPFDPDLAALLGALASDDSPREMVLSTDGPGIEAVRDAWRQVAVVSR